jgi:translation initiation factor 2A
VKATRTLPPIAPDGRVILISFAATKPAGAYRPPGARGLATPTIFKREDEGGVSHSPSNGISNPPSRAGTPANGARHGNHHYVPGAGHRQRAAPGAHPPGSPPPQEEGKRNRKKKGKKDGGGDASGDNVTSLSEVPPPVAVMIAPPIQAPVAEAPNTEGGLDPVAKRIRNLNKKVRLDMLFN